MKKIDKYIIRKFLSTFFYCLLLLLLVVIVIDMSEKIDDFIEYKLDIQTIVLKYYIHFIPYFANLFAPLFIFISVVFFTSKLASNSEIIAIFNSGMSFKRFLRPFILSSILLATLSFLLSNFIIPISNNHRINFEENYLSNKKKIMRNNINIQSSVDEYLYIEGYNTNRNIGYRFSLEEIKDSKLVSKIRANIIQWDNNKKEWILKNYQKRIFLENGENILIKKDTTRINLKLSPSDFIFHLNLSERMNLIELNENILKEEKMSSGRAKFYKIEKHKRIAFPFAIIILTLIAVSVSSKKIKGGVGYNLGLGLLISFSYIMFFQFSSTFSINGNLEPWIAVWIPNIIYMILSIILLKRAEKN